MTWPLQALNFAKGSTQSLTMTDANAGAFDFTKFTLYGRIKRISTAAADTHTIRCQQGAAGTDASFLLQFINDRLDFITSIDGVTVDGRLATTATFTSTSDWITFLIWFDSANATAGDRMRMWTATNGAALTEVTSFNIDTNPTAAARNSASAHRIGNNGVGLKPLDARVWQLAMFTGALLNPSDVEASGSPLDISGISSLYSLLDVAGGVVTHDSKNANAWTNVNAVTAVDDKPFAFTSQASTEDEDTLSAAARRTVTLSVGRTEDDDTLAGAGAIRITATVARSEEDDTVSSAGTVRLTASLSKTEEDDTVTSATKVKLTTALASTDDDDVASAAGKVKITTTLASTEDNDILVGAAAVRVTASVSRTEDDDAVSSASGVAIHTTLSATEQDDTASSSAAVKLTASLNSTAGDGSVSAAGAVKLITSLARTADDAVLSAASGVRVTGTAGMAGEDAGMAGAARVRVTGSLAQTGDDATVSALSFVINHAIAYLAATTDEHTLTANMLTGRVLALNTAEEDDVLAAADTVKTVRENYGAIRRLLETKLDTVRTLPVVWENVVASPSPGLAHLRAKMQYGPAMAAGEGIDAGHKYTGTFQITSMSPVGTGPQAGEAVIDDLCEFFIKGLRLVGETVKVVVEEPYIGRASTQDGWFAVPVYVPWFCYVL